MMLAKDVCRPMVKNGNIDFRLITSNIDKCPSSLKKGIFVAQYSPPPTEDTKTDSQGANFESDRRLGAGTTLCSRLW